MAERERIARLLYDAYYPNADLRTKWAATSEELRSTFRAMADALLAAPVGAGAMVEADPLHGLASNLPCECSTCRAERADSRSALRLEAMVMTNTRDAELIADLRAQLTTARARVAEVEGELEDTEAALFSANAAILRQIAFTEQLAGEKEQAEAREGALRAALEKLALAGEWVISCSERPSTVGATWPDLRDRIKHARGILAPTAGQGTS